jgi:hypothetical protein
MKADLALRALERCRDGYGGGAAGRKRTLLARLATRRLNTAGQVRRLHETLCFLRAYPDDAGLLDVVERLLARFEHRADLSAHREQLAASGIAGTTNWYPFFWPTARWLVARWPRQLRFDRSDAEAEKSLARALPLLVTPLEAAALRELQLTGYAAVDRLRADDETDATFLVRRVARLAGDDRTREAFYDAINPSCHLSAAAGVPARTHEKFGPAPVVFRSTPLRRGRPDLRSEMLRPPTSVRHLSAADGARLVELARGAMVGRARDLDAFAYGNSGDAWLVDDGGGLAFGLIGMTPERRAPLAAIYGGLILANGVPIGYIQVDLAGCSAALSYNTFDTFRGGEAAWNFARMLAMLRHVFGAVAFSIEPYQLGQGNDEGIASGAWWFYYKLGFRPRAASARRVLAAELARMQRRPEYRSPSSVLRQLAEHHLFFDFDRRRRTPLPPLAQIGLRVARLLAIQDPDRDRAIEKVQADAARILGLRSLRALRDAQRRAFATLSPLVLLAGAALWSPPQRRALLALILEKGADSEVGYVRQLVAHKPFCRVLLGQ